MAKRINKAKDIEVKAEIVQPEIKLKTFTLKRDYEGRKAGDTVKAGPKGEAFLKSKNII